LEFPLRSDLRNLSEEEITKKVVEVSRVLHIEHLLDRGTINLSGGEMQRVAIGRAIVRSPKVFLMDEPLSNLDAKLREEMRAELSRLHYDLGSTFFYVTHDQIEAMTMGDRVAVLNEGKILQVGTPDEIYNNPGNTFVAKFVGSPKINLIDVSVDGSALVAGENAMVLRVTGSHGKLLEKYGKSKLTLGIRPEDIEITKGKKSPGALACKVYFKQSLGVEDVLNLKIDNTLFKAISPPKILAKVGETVYANINMERAHLFDPDTDRRIS
jgi:multiple sugar transport system ATP-binding protein